MHSAGRGGGRGKGKGRIFPFTSSVLRVAIVLLDPYSSLS